MNEQTEESAGLRMFRIWERDAALRGYTREANQCKRDVDFAVKQEHDGAQPRAMR